MFKTHKWKWIISSLLILLPMAAGLLLWDHLPAQLASHWGANGEIDGYAGKAFVVFLFPVLMLIIHWVCLFFTFHDRKNKDQSKKALGLVFWIMPVISALSNGIVYAVALGMEPGIHLILPIFTGLLFCIIGNYTPKFKQNTTLGIKIRWTLDNEENWNATHRFTGKVWVAGGLALLFSALLPKEFMIAALLIVMLPMVILPVGYSYWYHRKQVRAGTATISERKANKTSIWITLILSAVTLAIIGLLMFCGDITVIYQDNAITVDSTFEAPLAVDYNAITDVEYREHLQRGERTWGFGSAKLLSGMFTNEEFGDYTLYAYTGCDASVVITADDGKILVIGGKDAASTKAIYNEILQRIAKDGGHS